MGGFAVMRGDPVRNGRPAYASPCSGGEVLADKDDAADFQSAVSRVKS